MKKSYALFVILCAVSLALSSCDDDSTTKPIDSNKGKLYVKFMNEANSEYTITSLHLKSMGEWPNETPVGDWGTNILTNGKRIPPGGIEYFYLDIPNQNWSKCRIAVDTGSSKSIYLDEQPGYEAPFNYSITHWASDERTVKVLLRKSIFHDYIEIGSWSDWSGIEN